MKFSYTGISDNTGIIVFGHTRAVSLENLLQSLRKQHINKNVHVWLDGHHGRPSLRENVSKSRLMVKNHFPEFQMNAYNGNMGIEKMMIDGLSYMADHYDRIIVLEDDCFPVNGAIYEFEKALDSIDKDDTIYSSYGHHFLTPKEGKTITRFQGWGWATTTRKLMPVLDQIKKCFNMNEFDYLRWVHQHLTPDVIKRLDVTPGRNCLPTVASFFCWDGATCIITAKDKLIHQKTEKRVIYNCGMGEGSTHFGDNQIFRNPPFNMITPSEVWDYFEKEYQETDSSMAQPSSQSNHYWFNSKFPDSLSVDGIDFNKLSQSKYKNTLIGESENHIIKIELGKQLLKLNNLSKEIEIIEHLNSKNCVSCPKLISKGTLKTGEKYFIQEKINHEPGILLNDKLFSIIEQKSFGVCQMDYRKENFLFSDSVAYIIDYDQAVMSEEIIHMNNTDFLNWMNTHHSLRWKNYGSDNIFKFMGYMKEDFLRLFQNNSLDIQHTSIFQNQITTNTVSGIYHSLKDDNIYIEGARGLDHRTPVMDLVEFEKGEKILDVGCNMGLLCHYLNDRGCSVTGIDMDKTIILGAKMVSNILQKNIIFKHLDLDHDSLDESYDTIVLFSVIHHVKNFKQITQNISKKCKRIIIECALKEDGYKPINSKWEKTTNWDFSDEKTLIDFLELTFSGFKFVKKYGEVDRKRSIYSFKKMV